MEYLDYLNRQELIQERARCSSELNQLKVKKESDESVNENVENVKNQLNEIIKYCDERLKAQKEEKVIMEGKSAAQNSVAETSFNGEGMVQSMQKTAKLQQIIETVRATTKLKTGDSVENFVCGLNQLYFIEIKPLLNEMPTLESEFVKSAMTLLTYPMFTQLQKSGKTINNWSDLEKYLISTHGSRISNFQYLHRLWNCQLHSEERFSDFGARLEEQIHHASMHIQASYKKNHADADMTASDVFALLGSMLAGLQVKEHHPDAYKSLIKTCDKHWSASSLLNDAADYSDKMQSSDTVGSNSNMAFHAKVMKIKKKTKNQDKKPETKSFRKKSSDRLEEYKKKCANEICEAFIKGNCKYGNRCFRIHPKQQNAHYSEVVEPEVEPEVKTEQSSIQNLFH